ncbi:hypothetical protein ACJMK2_021081 [Sinanodonta woodiana]|uniref:Uncharacterized protein n=1 Tax=Sinanodonta woodiana TaxID=1069815 RepID=A0ABD3U111_SINWO
MWITGIVIYFIISAVYGQTISDSTKLITDLLNGYDKLARPIADQSQPVTLYMSMDLVAIQEFDEVLEKFSFVAVISIIWEDTSMTWNASDYNGLTTIMIPQPNVWTPTLLVTNSFDTVKPIGADWMKVRYYDSGLAVYSPGDVFHTTCAVDVTFYPYDTQTCNIMLIPWGSLPNEITISASKDYVLKSYFTENGEWEVTSTSVTTATTDILSLIKFTIKLKRRPRFILVNVLLPVIFIGILNIMVFILPAESGERVSFCITVLLAFAVFLTIVGDNLPKTSKPMPMICYFLLVNLSLSTFICIMTILNLRLYHKPESQSVPRCLAALARKLSCICAPPRNAVQPFIQEYTNEKPGTKREKMSFKLGKESDQMCAANEKSVAAVNWKDISGMVDKVLFIFSSLWLIISSAMFVTMIEANQEII